MIIVWMDGWFRGAGVFDWNLRYFSPCFLLRLGVCVYPTAYCILFLTWLLLLFLQFDEELSGSCENLSSSSSAYESYGSSVTASCVGGASRPIFKSRIRVRGTILDDIFRGSNSLDGNTVSSNNALNKSYQPRYKVRNTLTSSSSAARLVICSLSLSLLPLSSCHICLDTWDVLRNSQAQVFLVCI